MAIKGVFKGGTHWRYRQWRQRLWPPALTPTVPTILTSVHGSSFLFFRAVRSCCLFPCLGTSYERQSAAFLCDLLLPPKILSDSSVLLCVVEMNLCTSCGPAMAYSPFLLSRGAWVACSVGLLFVGLRVETTGTCFSWATT